MLFMLVDFGFGNVIIAGTEMELGHLIGGLIFIFRFIDGLA